MTSEIANVERKGRNLVVNVVDCVDIGARKKVSIQYNSFIMFSLNYPVSMIFFFQDLTTSSCHFQFSAQRLECQYLHFVDKSAKKLFPKRLVH